MHQSIDISKSRYIFVESLKQDCNLKFKNNYKDTTKRS